MNYTEVQQTIDAAEAHSDLMMRLVDKNKEPNPREYEAMRLRLEAAKVQALLLLLMQRFGS